MIKVAVSGYCGKMGNRIAELANEDEDLEVIGGIERKSHPDIDKDIGELIDKNNFGISLTDDAKIAIGKADVLIEFTTPQATISNLEVCKENNVNMVIGTTGLTDTQLDEIEEASKDIAIVQSSNMSVGVNLLFELVETLAGKIHREANIEIIEIHHKFKKDAPSGTAKTIANIVSRVKNKSLEDVAVYGRKGQIGQRIDEEIGIHALRAGDIVGEHTIIFALNGERLELTHRAHTRDIFVLGAIKAAKFLKNKESGLYTMKDVLKG